MKKKVKCPQCKGVGEVIGRGYDEEHYVICSYCDGTGYVDYSKIEKEKIKEKEEINKIKKLNGIKI